jgi:serine/threonine protein kinase
MNEKGRYSVCPYCHLDHSKTYAPHHLRPGTILREKYAVGYAIGEGGFGITYIGRDLTLDVRVAVKEFYPSGYASRTTGSPEVIVSGERHRAFFDKGKGRFLTEARNIAKFSSEQGIVDVRDFFEANGTAYIIMEYLDGIDLGRYLEIYGTMPADRAFRLMLPIMHSLERIHAAGIIHRDISPDNIMYLRDGTLKLTDFGSARYFNTAETDMSILLKQGYAPEEQYRRNGKQGPWTDVYGMCAAIYRMITGVVPEDGIDRVHEDSLLRPSERGAVITPPLETVLMYGLAVFAENRCRSMTELIALTERALSGRPIRVGAGSPSSIPLHRAADAGYREAVTGYGDSYTEGGYRGEEEAPQTHHKPEKKRGWIIAVCIIAGLLIVGAIIAVIVMGANKNQPSDTEPTTVTDAATAAPTEAPPTEEAGIAVRDVVGLKLDRARQILQEQGFAVDVEYIADEGAQDHVARQSPAAGESLKKGETVTLYVPEEPSTEAPTEAPTESNAYVNMGDSEVWFHKTASRISECYGTGIPSGAEVEYLGETGGEFMRVRYEGVEGYVLSRYLVKAADAAFAPTVHDKEYKSYLTCKYDTELSPNREMTPPGVRIRAGESAIQVGYCPGENDDNSDSVYEIFYNGKVYYLPYRMLHDNFDFDNNF